MTVALVDHQALGAVLRGEPPAVLIGRPLATTGCWYVRLCQAVLSAVGRPGVLSGPFEHLPDARRRQAVDALIELPAEIELVSLALLGPAIGRLRDRQVFTPGDHDVETVADEGLLGAVTEHVVWHGSGTPGLSPCPSAAPHAF